MRKMMLTALAAAALAGSPTVADAQGVLTPTVSELAWARAKAVAYWHVAQPPCGRETMAIGSMAATISGQADYSTCSITLSAATDWRDFPATFCHVYVHEFGHLALGPAYFAASNPADPAHSADPLNIMNSGVSITARQFDAASRAVGCLRTLAPREHYRRGRHRGPPKHHPPHQRP